MTPMENRMWLRLQREAIKVAEKALNDVVEARQKAGHDSPEYLSAVVTCKVFTGLATIFQNMQDE